MKFNNILVEKENGLAKIIINRPKKLNALNKETIEALSTAIEASRRRYIGKSFGDYREWRKSFCSRR